MVQGDLKEALRCVQTVEERSGEWGVQAARWEEGPLAWVFVCGFLSAGEGRDLSRPVHRVEGVKGAL